MRRLVETWLCRWRGHQHAALMLERDRVYLQCDCGWTSPGFDVALTAKEGAR